MTNIVEKATKALPCPFCGGDPWFHGDWDEWHDDGRYIQLKIICCVSMRVGIGWQRAKVLTSKERETELKSALVENWNKRA